METKTIFPGSFMLGLANSIKVRGMQFRLFIEVAVVVGFYFLLSYAFIFIFHSVSAHYAADLTVSHPQTNLKLVGFYGAEDIFDYRGRWSRELAYVQLPLRYSTGAQYVASLRAQSILHPDGPQALTFTINQQPLVTVTPTKEFRTYHLLIPNLPQGDAAMRFGFTTKPFSADPYNRTVGLVTTFVGIQQLPLIKWHTVVGVTTAIFLLWVFLRLCGIPFHTVLLICGIAGVTLVMLQMRYDEAPLPYLCLALLSIFAVAIVVFVGRSLWVRMALTITLILVAFMGMLWPSWFSDDAFISFHYAQNFVRGHGLVYNVGERVEGYTNFLWTMLAALVIWLGGDPVFWAYVFGVSLALALVLATFVLARWLLGEFWALVAVLIVATNQSMHVYTSRGSGMETGLFGLLILVGSGLYLDRRYVWCGLVLALSALTRPEGVLVMTLTLGHLTLTALLPLLRSFCISGRAGSCIHSAHERRHLVSHILYLLLPFLAIMIPYFFWRYSYYSDLLPNTFYAKTGGGFYQALRGFNYAGNYAVAIGGPLLLVIFLPPFNHNRGVSVFWWGYLLSLTMVFTVYIITIGGDHFPGERFFAPLTPWFAILLAGGLSTLFALTVALKAGRLFAPFLLVITLFIFSWHALWRSQHFDHILVGNDESVRVWREIGWWMHDNTPPDASIAVLGAGAIAYYGERETIDMLGLTDKHIGRLVVENMGMGVAGHEKHDPYYVMYIRKPTYIPRIWDSYFAGNVNLHKKYTLITVKLRSGRTIEIWKRKS
jgi:arabinofuranosyltransferase